MHPISRTARVLAAALLTFLALAGAGVAPAAANPQPLALVLRGTIVGPDQVTGTWTASGALSDSGTYSETFRFSRDGNVVDVVKVLVGSGGTLVLEAHAHAVWLSPTHVVFARGRWWIELGTGAYAGLRASGRPAVTPDSFGDLASGEVAVTHEGLVRG